MLKIRNISKSFGVKPVLKNINFHLSDGNKVGLIGLNGCGKSTLLQIIAGEIRSDGGSVEFMPAGLRVGYLHQGLKLPDDETVGSFLIGSRHDHDEIAKEVERIALELSEQPDNQKLANAFDFALNQLQNAGVSSAGAEEILTRFGLMEIPLDWPIANLSGGQKTRLGLAGILLSNPQLLLLDEPTNHLDIEMLEWLESWLKQTRITALIVSHDRTFLDAVVEGILELDEHTHTIRQFAGSYSDYLCQKRAEQEKQWQAYTDQQDEIRRLKKAAIGVRDLARYHRGGKTEAGSTDGFSIGYFANRGKETVQRAKNIEKRIEHLLTDERVERPSRSWQMKVDFQPVGESGRDVVVMEDLSIGYGQNMLAESIDLTVRYCERIALVGPNGCGKSTLLKTVVGEILSLGGSVRLGAGVKCGYLAQEQETLNPNLTVLETLLSINGQSETEARSFLSKYLFMGDDVFTPVLELSYGEKVRLQLACQVADGCNLLLLDEPVNHLDIPSRERFEQALGMFQGTVLAVVHDRAFIHNFAKTVWKFEGKHVFPDHKWNL